MASGIQQADVCIICALKEEADAVEQVISELCRVEFTTSATDDDRLVYRYTTIINKKQEPLTLLLFCQTRRGPVSTALDLGTLLQVFQPCFVGMNGICAGDKRYMHLGDLVVAEHAYHFEEGKVTRDQRGTVVHQPEGTTYGPAESILQYVRTLEAWKTPVAELKKCVFHTDEPPRCIITPMASGMAVRCDDPFDILQRQHRKTWALDMEAAAFYQALHSFPGMNGLVVKGVCDYADLSKDDTSHDFAARASAIYLLIFIQEYVTNETLSQWRRMALSSETSKPSRRSALQNQNRVRMLRQMRTIWIDGLLTQSLHHATSIELCLQDRPDVLANPWRLQVQELDQVPNTLPDGTTIVQVYDRAEGELLILGEAGAGKTTLLLELTRILLERAEKDERLPMPIVFNLSSWAEKRQTLHLWLVEELWMKYQVPHKIGQDWIDGDQILPLLDGLDEVAKEARTDCVQKINDYYHSRLECGSSPIVVCCRSEEYVALSTRVILQHAVSILPLTDEQINTYLEQAGEQVKGLRQALNEDAELYSLARQPLMLNIFILACQGVISVEVPTGETRERIRHCALARYVERMLKRRGQSKRWKPEQVTRSLMFLGKQMQQHNLTVFSVENLQPTWLSRRWRILYEWSVRLVSGLLWGLLTVLVSTLAIPTVFGLFFGPAGATTSTPAIRLIVALAVALFSALDTRINPAKALTWSWKKARSELGIALIIGLFTGLFLKLVSGEMGWLGVGLLAGLVGGLSSGLSGRRLPERLFLSPNAGIWHSGKNGLVAVLVGGPLFGSVFGLVSGLLLGLNAGLIFGPNFGLVFGLLGWLLFGLATFVKHFLLRFFLSRRGDLPWDLVPFLDEAAERLLLRKVGGSYIFVHRLLLDYFADLEKKRHTGDGFQTGEAKLAATAWHTLP